MKARDNMDHLYGRVIGMLVQKGRVLDRTALLAIRAECNTLVSESKVLWCENLTMAQSAMMVSNWEGKLPVHKNPN